MGQENGEIDALANYAYAVFFGTGVYNVNEQTAFILNIPLAYNWYADSPNFLSGTEYTENVSGEFEWGIALGFEKPPVILGLKIQRIGLGFRYGDDIKGIRLITRFPF